MNFFVDLTKSLLSPRALQGFIIGLFIGGFTVLISSHILRPFITDDNLLAIIGNLIGAAFVVWYGIWFAGKTQGRKSSAIAVFFIAGLIGFFLIRDVIEKLFGLPPDQLINNVISYAVSCGITCALAGGFFEAITQSE
jgi:hypothetical protein